MTLLNNSLKFLQKPQVTLELQMSDAENQNSYTGFLSQGKAKLRVFRGKTARKSRNLALP